MSEDNLNLDETEVHYVYGDQEYVLGHGEINSELRDLICSDGSRAILVDGQYIVTDNQAILLQEGDTNLTQYYIGDNSEGYVVDEDSSTNLFQTECIQLVEEDTNDVQQVIYYTNEDSNIEGLTPVTELTEGEGLEGIQDEEGNIYPFKRVKLEGQLLNFDEFVQQQESETNQSGTEYNVLEETVNESEQRQPDETLQEAPEPIIDLAKITGRNLITGQTVTLHSYMEKLKKRLNKNSALGKKSPKRIYNDLTPVNQKSEEKKSDLSDLLDRKISIGKTKSGKKIVGKIIHVEKKNVNVNNEEERVEEVEEEQTKILVKKSTVSIESFEQISKILGGVMEMESVRKKLENKNIVVKLVEKKYVTESDSFVKNTSYSYGYMEQEFNAEGEEEQKWKFVPDQDTQDVLLGEHFTEEEEVKKKATKFSITTSLTILITYEKDSTKTIRVNLNPAPGNLCTICAQYFKTNLQLRNHMHHAHNTYGNNTLCEICDKPFDDLQKLQEHRSVHVQEGKLFICSKCSKCFATQTKLQKHLPTHDVYLRPLECSVCEVRCASEWSLKKHLLTHTGIKPFGCDMCSKQFTTQYDLNFHKKVHFPEKHFTCNVCMRTFSRHSNLLRHAEIHKGTGALYKCEICYCSYNYISSLTRHMVQHHIVEKT